MVYLLKNNKKNNLKKKIIFVGFFLLIAYLFSLGQSAFLNIPLTFVSKPLIILKNKSLDYGEEIFSFFITRKQLNEENNLLKDELFKNKLFIINQNLLLKENIELKKMLGRTNLDSKSILANVILKPGLSAYNSLLLDIGSHQGIKKGDKVLVEGFVIVGEIDESYFKTSKVKLYSFPREQIEVAVGFNKILTIAEAVGDGVFVIKLPQGTGIKKGDVVTLPEEDLRILGLVEQIIINPEDPFETILFKSPVNFFELRWVQVIQER